MSMEDETHSKLEDLKMEKSDKNGALNDILDCDETITSAHTVGHDSWKQVGVMLATAYTCGYILSFSYLMLAPLGWSWGITSLVVAACYVFYSSWLLSSFHFIDGKRFIRYRDLMGHVFGKKMYYLTWIFQFLTLFLASMGFILLGGRALKEIHLQLINGPDAWRLQYFIAIAGVAYFLFAFFIPTMSAMKVWLGFSTLFTSTYTIFLLVFLVKDGKAQKNKNYEVNSDSEVDKVFNALGAIAAIVACNSSPLLPEIQSTLKRPAVINMRKALSVQFSAGLMVYYGVIIVGYWAYGSSVSWYLPHGLSGPKWVKILVNFAVFLQAIVSQHMFASPIHEALDTKFLNLEESIYSKENLKRRFVLRGLFFAMNTFFAASFPFMGDFVTLFGSLTLTPLNLVFPNMIFVKVMRKKASVLRNLWHWFNIIFFTLLAIATTIAAVRLIINNGQQYSLFADT